MTLGIVEMFHSLHHAPDKEDGHAKNYHCADHDSDDVLSKRLQFSWLGLRTHVAGSERTPNFNSQTYMAKNRHLIHQTSH